MDLAAALAQNAQMKAAGTALEQQVAALEAEKAALLRAAAASGSATAGSGQPGAPAPHHGYPKGPTPPEFHGTKTGGYEIDSWIRDMRTQFTFYGARVFPNEAAMVRHAAMFLKGRAAEWWEAEDKSTGVESSWDLFVERLRERYRPMQAAVVARERLRRLKQTGSVSAYADVFQKELTPIKDMSASDQVFNFVTGLSNAAVANKVREKEPKSLHEAMDIAVRAELFLAAGRSGAHGGYPHQGRGANMSSAAASVPMDVNAIDISTEAETGQSADEAPANAHAAATTSSDQMAAALMAKVEAMVQHRVAAMLQQHGRGAGHSGDNRSGRIPGLTPADIELLRAEGRCFRCKQKGHSKRDCPQGNGKKVSFQ
jgi:hypothetical protein